ncbi:MAG: hypothetical protein IH908_06085 [Proteobacteria bacterium]|nr:hypothetical protein [Pseudomonadota bacterium]
MPDFVQGNLTARITYDIKNAFGIGQATYYLPGLSDSDFQEDFSRYSFWDGRGYLRAEGITQDSAIISVYSSESRPVSTGFGQQRFLQRKVTSVNLKEGQTSPQRILLPGFDFCLASLQLRLDSVELADTRAKLKINADIIEIADNEQFLENRCVVRDIKKQGVLEKVRITCREDDVSGIGIKGSTFDLTISPKIKFEVDGRTEEASVGDFLYRTEDNKKSIYLGYVGKVPVGDEKETYIFLVNNKENKRLLNKNYAKTSTTSGPTLVCYSYLFRL